MSGRVVKSKSKRTNTYKVIVDYGLSLETMIAAGKYDWVNDSITSENFPHDARLPEEVEIRLFNLGHMATDDEALAELDKLGLRPAILPELLALGATYSDLQRKFWIVALGSGWQGPVGTVRRPVLGAGDGKRGLVLHWGDLSIKSSVDRCFAVIRK